jgi:hypothetical protein
MVIVCGRIRAVLSAAKLEVLADTLKNSTMSIDGCPPCAGLT